MNITYITNKSIKGDSDFPQIKNCEPSCYPDGLTVKLLGHTLPHKIPEAEIFLRNPRARKGVISSMVFNKYILYFDPKYDWFFSTKTTPQFFLTIKENYALLDYAEQIAYTIITKFKHKL